MIKECYCDKISALEELLSLKPDLIDSIIEELKLFKHDLQEVNKMKNIQMAKPESVKLHTRYDDEIYFNHHTINKYRALEEYDDYLDTLKDIDISIQPISLDV